MLGRIKVFLLLAVGMTSQMAIGQDREIPLQELTMTLPRSTQLSASEAESLELSYQKALDLILSDSRDPESPLALAQTLGLSKTRQRELLCEHLQRPSTRLRLYLGPESGLPLPDAGEDPRKEWIFLLDMPSFSDHYFWIVIDKSNRERARIYGFN